MTTKKLKASTEFKVGKHNIGWINDRFLGSFGDKTFTERPMPKFQTLPRDMTDAAIESELKPGLCELGDILAFLDNAPEEYRDNCNLFYTPDFVVRVLWGSFRRRWYVSTWYRGDDAWGQGCRVFSQATKSSGTKSSVTLEPSAPASFEARIKALEDWREHVITAYNKK